MRTIAGLNVLLVLGWLWLAWAIVKENARLSAQQAEAKSTAAA